MPSAALSTSDRSATWRVAPLPSSATHDVPAAASSVDAAASAGPACCCACSGAGPPAPWPAPAGPAAAQRAMVEASRTTSAPAAATAMTLAPLSVLPHLLSPFYPVCLSAQVNELIPVDILQTSPGLGSWM